MIRTWTVMLVAAGALGGCATLTRGTTDEVRVEVDPPTAIITSSIGQSCQGIPCRMQVPRKTEFQVTASLTGYHPESVQVTSTVAPGGVVGLAGNAIIGGLIGVGVDAISGATLNHTPNPVIMALRPIDPDNEATPPGDRAVIENRLSAEEAARQRRKAEAAPTS